MKRGTRFRISGCFLAALLLLSGAREALGIGECPHHDAVPASTAPADAHGAAGHGHTPAAAHGAGSHAPADHSGACTCLGQCQAGTVAALAGAAGAQAQPPDEPESAHPASERLAALPGPTPYALPLAHAPPAGC